MPDITQSYALFLFMTIQWRASRRPLSLCGKGGKMSNPRFSKVRAALSNVWSGYSRFDKEHRELFKSEILNTAYERTRVVLVVILLIQAANLLFSSVSGPHSEYFNIFRAGCTAIASVCVVYSFIFFVSARIRELSFKTKNLILNSFWILILLSSFLFVYCDLMENMSITNTMLFIIAIGIIKIMSFTEIIVYLFFYLAATFALFIHVSAPLYLVQHTLTISYIALYISQSQFLSAAATFKEKQRLSSANDDLARLSETDPLTGLLNRRGLEKKIASREIPGNNICVLMMDIDFFKFYNDKFLHTAGDDCLVRIASCLRDCAALDTDITVRFGGEEFLIIRSVCDAEHTIPFALHAKNSIEQLKIRFDYNDLSPFVTVSIGVSSYFGGQSPVSADLLYDLIEEADRELYRAKAYGRNCVSCCGNIYR